MTNFALCLPVGVNAEACPDKSAEGLESLGGKSAEELGGDKSIVELGGWAGKSEELGGDKSVEELGGDKSADELGGDKSVEELGGGKSADELGGDKSVEELEGWPDKSGGNGATTKARLLRTKRWRRLV